MADKLLGKPSTREKRRLGEVLAEVLPRDLLFRAIVTDVNGNLVTFQRPGQSAYAQGYPKLASYSSPQTDDEVLVARVGGGFVVLGEIER